MNIDLKDIFVNNNPDRYIPSVELIRAVEIAYALKRPLLLSGEPGTGKTEFARWVASNLYNKGFLDRPVVYNTKSSSIAQDLFYYYDAVSHFRETNINPENTHTAERSRKTTEDFIELKALGLAFANAKGRQNLEISNKIAIKSKINESPVSSVVLIDEIDKAPRDFPNDLLNEIERYEFEIKEINQKIELTDEERKRILVIMTSNFEKNLPEPFLRRCVYYHIEFPSPERLIDIIKNRLNIDNGKIESLKRRVDDFFVIRSNQHVQKKPSTSECIDWMRVLNDANLISEPLFDEQKRIKPGSSIVNYLPVLLKMKEDLQLFKPKG
jgi:MoxR-like ATPase